MAIPVVEATQEHNVTSNAGGSGTITLSLGTISENDVIVSVIALDGNAGSPIVCSGNNSSTFDPVGSDISEGTVECKMHWQRQGATPDTSISYTWTGSEQARIMIIRVSGCLESASIEDVIGTGATGTGTTATPTSPTSTVADTLYIAACAVDRDRVILTDGVTGTGWSDVGNAGSSGGANGAGLLVGELDQASIGTPANPTFGTWTSDGFASYMFNLKGESDAGFAHSQGCVIG